MTTVLLVGNRQGLGFACPCTVFPVINPFSVMVIKSASNHCSYQIPASPRLLQYHWQNLPIQVKHSRMTPSYSSSTSAYFYSLIIISTYAVRLEFVTQPM